MEILAKACLLPAYAINNCGRMERNGLKRKRRWQWQWQPRPAAKWKMLAVAIIFVPYLIYTVGFLCTIQLSRRQSTSLFPLVSISTNLSRPSPEISYLQQQLHRCPLPLNSSLWNYYDALVDENIAMTERVRDIFDLETTSSHSVTNKNKKEHEIIGDVQNNKAEKSRIPHLLIFTHKDNLFNCSISASNSSIPSNLHVLAENAKATVRAYSRIWPDMKYMFLSDDDCIDALNLTEPDLIPFFKDQSLEGMYKADLCRVAYLVLHGGYYFDVDILVIEPYVAPTNATLVTVTGFGAEVDVFFQAFIAAEKGNIILLNSLRIMLEILQKTRISRGFLGPTSLMDAWREDHENANNGLSANNSTDGVHLLTECLLTDTHTSTKCNDLLPTVIPNGMTANLMQHSPGDHGLNCRDLPWNICNHVVLDDENKVGGRQQIYFYSRVVGTSYCGKICK